MPERESNKLLHEIPNVMRIARGLGTNPAGALFRFAALRAKGKFSSNEIFTLALLDPQITQLSLKSYKSKEQAWPVYEELNRHADLSLLNDKVKFNNFCEKNKLPTIPCSRIIRRDHIRSLLDKISAGDSNAGTVLLQELPDQFVVKPTLGYQGLGIQFFKKDEQRIISLDKQRRINLREFVESLESGFSTPTMNRSSTGTEEQALLFQEIGIAHSQLAELSGSSIMQSLRICTFLDDFGRGSVLFAFLKISAGGNLIDNFQKGVTGNLLGYVDHKRGLIFRAIGRDPELGFNRVVTHHPDTGVAIVGFKVPHWEDALALALRSASVFGNTRAIGWDIGITPKGPVLIEGNGTWDPVAPLYRALPTVNGRY